MAKRLKRNKKGSIILPSGERITPKEQKDYVNLVRRANYRRDIEFQALPEVAKQRHKDFGGDNEFYIRKKSPGFGHFESREEFNRYKKTLRRITSGQFKKKNLKTMYDNYIEGLKKTFNSKADPLISVIKELNEDELSAFINAEELNDLGYVYHDTKGVDEKLEVIYNQIEKIKTKVAKKTNKPVKSKKRKKR